MLKYNLITIVICISWVSLSGQMLSRPVCEVLLKDTNPENDFFIRINYKTANSAMRTKIYHNQAIYSSFQFKGYSVSKYIKYMEQVLPFNKPLILKDSSDILIRSDCGEHISSRMTNFIDSILKRNHGDASVFFENTNAIANQYTAYAGEIAYLLWGEGIYIKAFRKDQSLTKFGIGLIDPASKSKYLAKYRSLFARPYKFPHYPPFSPEYRIPVYIRISPSVRSFNEVISAQRINVDQIVRDSIFTGTFTNSEGEVRYRYAIKYPIGTFTYEMKVNGRLTKGQYTSDGILRTAYDTLWSSEKMRDIYKPYKYYDARKFGKWEYFDENGNLIKEEEYK